ncbi:MAG: hypothetical protein HYY76_15890 [Acidobacteria bacterium]|nr:hypothetical protein [Acidobacteriota bacterium]
MPIRFRGSVIGIALASAAVSAAIAVWLIRTVLVAQPSPLPRTVDGQPDFSGIWQANNEAHWDLEAHEARAGAVVQQGAFPWEFVKAPAAPSLPFGAAGGVPGSIGVVDGDGRIPYRPEALKIKNENAQNWIDRDPELKCYLPGTPRAMYMPYPFQIVQGTNKIAMTFTFSNATRVIHLDQVESPPDTTYMGHSVGRWEGDTLVVDVTHFNGRTWFDRAGNFHSDALHVVERFTPMTPNVFRYEVTIEDPQVFTRPWTISMPIYRRLEPNMRLMEYRCIEFVEEFLYGHLRREQLVRHWEGETIAIDIRRKVPPGDKLYERIGQ